LNAGLAGQGPGQLRTFGRTPGLGHHTLARGQPEALAALQHMVQPATVARDPDPAVDHAEPAARPCVQAGGAVQPQVAGRPGQHLPARRLMLLAHVDLLGEYPQ
jgi:hypothetical protein